MNTNKEEDEIFTNILDHGCTYLDELLHKYHPEDAFYNTLLRYIKNYIIDDDIFEDSQEQFINYMMTKNTNLWASLCDSKLLDDSKAMTLIQEFQYEVDSMNFDQKIIFLKNLIRSPRVKKLMYHPSRWEFNTGHCIEHSMWIGKLLSELSVDEEGDEYNIKADKILYFLVDLLKESGDIRSELEDRLVTCFANISNFNLGNKNVGYMTNNDGQNMSSDSFLINSSYLLLKLWDIFYVTEESIDYSFITDTQCPIKWFTKKTDTKKKYQLPTKLFFLVLNIMRVCYTPILMRATNWPQVIEDLNKTREVLENDGGMLSELNLLNLYTKIKSVKDKYNLYESLCKNTFVCHNITKFYCDFVELINNPQKLNNPYFNWDDTLDDLTYFYLNKSINIELDDQHKRSLLDLAIQIIESQKITNNPEKRNCFMKIVDKIIDQDSSFVKPEQMSRIIRAVIQLINDYNSYNENHIDYFFRKMTSLRFIILVISRYTIGNNRKGGIILVDQVLKLEPNKAKKFISIMYNDCCWIGENMDTKLDNIKKSFYLSQDSYNSSLDLYKMVQSHEMLLSYIGIFLTNIPEFKRLSGLPEILTTLVITLNTSLTRIHLEFKYNFTYLSPEDLQTEKLEKIDMIKYFFNILSPYLTFSNQEKFIEYVVGDITNFKVDYLKSSIIVLKELNIDNKLIDTIEQFINKLEEVDLDQDSDDDYPEEFLDPLTYTKIECPIILPINDSLTDKQYIYMEDYVIKKHILQDQNNPFTREPLTLDQLEEYNNKPEIITKLKAFKQKIADWNSKN